VRLKKPDLMSKRVVSPRTDRIGSLVRGGAREPSGAGVAAEARAVAGGGAGVDAAAPSPSKASSGNFSGASVPHIECSRGTAESSACV